MFFYSGSNNPQHRVLIHVSLVRSVCIFFMCFSVVQRMDDVTEGMENYEGKIIAVETDLKKLGEFYLKTHHNIASKVLLFSVINLYWFNVI